MSLGKLESKKGVTIVMIAILIPVILLFLALVFDIGVLYVAKSQLQTAADAASLAGAAYSDKEVCIHKPTDKDALRIEKEGSKEVLYVKIYIKLDEGRAKKRAENVLKKYEGELIGNTTILSKTCKLVGKKGEGKVNYWGKLKRVGSKGYEVDHKNIELDKDSKKTDNNKCYVKLEASMPTVLLGPITSVFDFNKDSDKEPVDFNRLIVIEESIGEFNHKKAF